MKHLHLPLFLLLSFLWDTNAALQAQNPNNDALIIDEMGTVSIPTLNSREYNGSR